MDRNRNVPVAPLGNANRHAFDVEPLDPRVLLSAGSLNTSFGTGGKMLFDVAGSDDFGSQVVVQPDGRIVMAGYTGSGSTGHPRQAAFARFTAP
jgi:hypothetical protein